MLVTPALVGSPLSQAATRWSTPLERLEGAEAPAGARRTNLQEAAEVVISGHRQDDFDLRELVQHIDIP
jgi:hypothetical protein